MGFIAFIWLLLFAFVSLATAQISVNTKYHQSGRSIEITGTNIDSVTAKLSESVDISSLDGQTVYYTGYAYGGTGASSHDSVRVALLAHWKVGSNNFYVGIDTIYIPVRSTFDSAKAILQTPSMSFTGYMPSVKIQMLSASSGTNEQTARDVQNVFMVIYSRVEDTVPPNRQFQYVQP